MISTTLKWQWCYFWHYNMFPWQKNENLAAASPETICRKNFNHTAKINSHFLFTCWFISFWKKQMYDKAFLMPCAISYYTHSCKAEWNMKFQFFTMWHFFHQQPPAKRARNWKKWNISMILQYHPSVPPPPYLLHQWTSSNIHSQKCFTCIYQTLESLDISTKSPFKV